METSILNTIKGMLGASLTDDSFDEQIINHINARLTRLYQIGLGTTPFKVTGEIENWTDLTEKETLVDMLKDYIYFSVKIEFDPPLNSTVLDSIKKLRDEYEWSIQTEIEFGGN